MARIDEILRLVKEQGASDLHLAAGSPPVVRIDGEIQPIPHERFSADLLQQVLLDMMDPVVRARFDESRDVDFAYEVPGSVRARCHVFDQRRGLAGAFRLLPGEAPTPEQLGLPPHVTRLIDVPRGLVVVTGPPGSGKSSTLAALVDRINRTRPRHILTIEDPIEFVHPNRLSMVSQREVGRHTPSFARALRGALREDPDVVLVGEMRDAETLALALDAAATGRLVLAALHTTSAAQAVDHVLDSFPDERRAQARLMLAESLRAVLAQRLLRRADGEGRVLALEILVGTPAVASLIRERKTFQLGAAIQAGRREGMQTMDGAVAALVRSGDVDPEEADRQPPGRDAQGPLREAA